MVYGLAYITRAYGLSYCKISHLKKKKHYQGDVVGIVKLPSHDQASFFQFEYTLRNGGSGPDILLHFPGLSINLKLRIIEKFTK